MAVRLPVVVSQSSRRDGRSVDIEESLITQLMLTSGLDATVVASLDAIQLDSTDHLCLQDLGQEFFLAGWLPLDSALQAWDRLGLAGHLLSFETESLARSNLGNVSGQRVRYVQLTHQTVVASVIEQLQQVLASRRVQTVSIQPLIKSPPSRDASPPRNQHPQDSPSASKDSLRNAETNRLDQAPALSTSTVDPKPNDWASLDKLVDDLDAFDL